MATYTLPKPELLLVGAGPGDPELITLKAYRALQQARVIAWNLAGARGWNGQIITQTSRALAVVLAECQPGDMIAWSQLPAACCAALRNPM